MELNYCIIAVHYHNGKEGTYLESVKIDETTEVTVVKTRERVILDIAGEKKNVKTAIQKAGKWVEGEEVRVITVNGEKFIRTDENESRVDDLGELPRF